MPRHLKDWAKSIRLEIHAVYIAGRDPRVPWHAKALAVIVAAYALSPIDLIPDFIPVLGYLDDLIILPAGIWLVVRLIPRDVMDECRAAAKFKEEQPASRAGAAIVVAVWVLAAILLLWLLWPSPARA